ncbi:hypothetical protein GQ600_6367 [Phytophthora cactorum]|nr:hypothetical protein GQ600_6367 [Phytophthora cactorum]
MEAVLQSFYEQKYGKGVNSYYAPEPCMECHHLITREENSSSIDVPRVRVDSTWDACISLSPSPSMPSTTRVLHVF